VGGQYWCEKTVKKILELILDTIQKLYIENPNLIFKIRLAEHILVLKTGLVEARPITKQEEELIDSDNELFSG
jgi:hypothetical protein